MQDSFDSFDSCSKNIFAFFSKSVSNPICPVKVQSKEKSSENPKEKIQKTNPCKDSEKNR